MASYDDTGPVVPWRVKAGDPIVKTWTVTVDNVPLTVSGATATGRVSESEGGATVQAFTVTYPSASSVKVSYPAGLTAGKYWWALRVLMADGVTVYRGQGPLVVEPAGI